MVFINYTGISGTLISSFNNNFSGNEFITLLIIFIIILFGTLALRLDIEWSIILLLPIAIVFAAGNSLFLPIVAIMILILVIMFVLNFPALNN